MATQEEYIKNTNNLMKKIRNIFRNTEDGKIALELMKEIYLLSPTCDINNVNYSYVREGENNLVRWFIKLSKCNDGEFNKIINGNIMEDNNV